ncbi:MAG: flagellar hook-length control protein FliK, partial [Rhizobacter sp.]
HRWLFPAYAWAGLHVMLRLVEPDDEPPRPPRRRRGPMALRIEVDAPSLGGIELHLQLLGQGIALVFFVERHAALAVVRQAVPTIAQALAAAGLRLLRCGVVRGLPPLTGTTRLDAWPAGVSAAAVLPPLLFRAAAEVTVAFAPLLLPRDVKPWA